MTGVQTCALPILNRSEKFFAIRKYDAVLYDLGSLSKMGSRADSIYYSQSVSAIYQGGGEKAVGTLSDLIEYFRKAEPGKQTGELLEIK